MKTFYGPEGWICVHRWSRRGEGNKKSPKPEVRICRRYDVGSLEDQNNFEVGMRTERSLEGGLTTIAYKRSIQEMTKSRDGWCFWHGRWQTLWCADFTQHHRLGVRGHQSRHALKEWLRQNNGEHWLFVLWPNEYILIMNSYSLWSADTWSQITEMVHFKKKWTEQI